jgi:hypothetical protein
LLKKFNIITLFTHINFSLENLAHKSFNSVSLSPIKAQIIANTPEAMYRSMSGHVNQSLMQYLPKSLSPFLSLRQQFKDFYYSTSIIIGMFLFLSRSASRSTLILDESITGPSSEAGFMFLGSWFFNVSFRCFKARLSSFGSYIPILSMISKSTLAGSRFSMFYSSFIS